MIPRDHTTVAIIHDEKRYEKTIFSHGGAAGLHAHRYGLWRGFVNPLTLSKLPTGGHRGYFHAFWRAIDNGQESTARHLDELSERPGRVSAFKDLRGNPIHKRYARRNVILIPGRIDELRRDYGRLESALKVAKFHESIPRFTVVVAGSMTPSGRNVTARLQKSFPGKSDRETRVDILGDLDDQDWAALHRAASLVFPCSIRKRYLRKASASYASAVSHGVPLLIDRNTLGRWELTAKHAVVLYDVSDIRADAASSQNALLQGVASGPSETWSADISRTWADAVLHFFLQTKDQVRNSWHAHLLPTKTRTTEFLVDGSGLLLPIDSCFDLAFSLFFFFLACDYAPFPHGRISIASVNDPHQHSFLSQFHELWRKRSAGREKT